MASCFGMTYCVMAAVFYFCNNQNLICFTLHIYQRLNTNVVAAYESNVNIVKVRLWYFLPGKPKIISFIINTNLDKVQNVFRITAIP